MDFRTHTVQVDSKRIKLQIWDTGGQERFRTITTGVARLFVLLLLMTQCAAYYSDAQGIMIVYDVTDERSFEGVRHFFRLVDQNANSNVQKVLVANKCDLTTERVE